MTESQIPVFLDKAGKELSFYYAIFQTIAIVIYFIYILFFLDKTVDKKNEDNEKKTSEKVLSIVMFVSLLLSVPMVWLFYYLSKKYTIVSQVFCVLFFISILVSLFKFTTKNKDDDTLRG
jgi:uncharacterized membrane protein AbrB (regulator of aidB expression)